MSDLVLVLSPQPLFPLVFERSDFLNRFKALKDSALASCKLGKAFQNLSKMAAKNALFKGVP